MKQNTTTISRVQICPREDISGECFESFDGLCEGVSKNVMRQLRFFRSGDFAQLCDILTSEKDFTLLIELNEAMRHSDLENFYEQKDNVLSVDLKEVEKVGGVDLVGKLLIQSDSKKMWIRHLPTKRAELERLQAHQMEIAQLELRQ